MVLRDEFVPVLSINGKCQGALVFLEFLSTE